MPVDMSNDRASLVASDTSLFQCATVFTQFPQTHHFLAVPFDAGSRNVSDGDGWHELGFTHDTGLAPPGVVYSYFEIHGDHYHLAAPGSAPWIGELFPEQYHCEPQPRQTVSSTALTGELTLVLAVIAFSCREDQLDYVLRHCWRQGQWEPHGLPHGREFAGSLNRHPKLTVCQCHRTRTPGCCRFSLP